MKSNSFRKVKAIASLPILSPYFRIFFFFQKKRFLRKSSKPGHVNLVLITSTAQVELSKLNFNFDDIRTYFLLVLLRDCRPMTFVTFNRFFPLSKIKHPPYGQYQDGQNTNQNFLHSVSSFEGTSYKNLYDTVTRSFISCCFLAASTSEDIVFHNLSVLHLALSEKKIFVTNFLF